MIKTYAITLGGRRITTRAGNELDGRWQLLSQISPNSRYTLPQHLGDVDSYETTPVSSYGAFNRYDH